MFKGNFPMLVPPNFCTMMLECSISNCERSALESMWELKDFLLA